MEEGLITNARFDEGRWVGFLSCAGEQPVAPEIGVHLNGRDLGDVSCTAEEDGRWKLEFQIPPDALEGGVSTFLFVERKTSELLGRFCIIAGNMAEQDVVAQLDTLRSELDQLKSAFRRQARRSQADQ